MSVLEKMSMPLSLKQRLFSDYSKSAETGDSISQYLLGACWDFGFGVEKDFVKAVEWYTKAAEAGFAKAQFWLGRCYENGQGVEEDLAKAEEWKAKAKAVGFEGW